MKTGVVADVGRSAMHIGDEAIGVSAGAALRARGIEPVWFTHGDSRPTAAEPGESVHTALQLGTDPTRQSLALAAVERYFDGDLHALVPFPEVERVLEIVAGLDAVLVAGGGNLSSAFGTLLYERLVLLRLAQRLGKPTVAEGQSIGPTLTDTDAQALTRALADCQLVGARDQRSYDLLAGLLPREHPGLRLCLDDASFLGLPPLPESDTPEVGTPESGTESFRRDEARRPLVVGTFSAWTGPVDRQAVAQSVAAGLDAFAERIDAEVRLVPHQATPGGADLDAHMHDLVVTASRSGRIHAEPVSDPLGAAASVDSADLVVTSRFHPLVFALARDVPTLALPLDDYGDARMDGALRHWGMGGWAVPLPSLRDGELAAALAELWEQRHPIRSHLAAAHTALLEYHAYWWDVVATALRGPHGQGAESPPPWAPTVTQLSPPAGLARMRQAGQLATTLTRDLAALRAELARSSSELDRLAAWSSPGEPDRSSATELARARLERDAAVVELGLYVARYDEHVLRAKETIRHAQEALEAAHQETARVRHERDSLRGVIHELHDDLETARAAARGPGHRR